MFDKKHTAPPSRDPLENPAVLSTVVQILTEQGSGSFDEGIRLLGNEAMFRERSTALRAVPCQGSEERLGQFNGFKAKARATRVGRIPVDVTHVRGGPAFYAFALEKGVRSEQCLKIALAAIYVQSVSTR